LLQVIASVIGWLGKNDCFGGSCQVGFVIVCVSVSYLLSYRWIVDIFVMTTS